MSKSIPGNQKHLSLQDRILIEKKLDEGLSFRKIARLLEKDPSTISKEIQKHRSFSPHSPFNQGFNKCAHCRDCKKKDICQIYAPVCKKLCRGCRLCNSKCPDFIPKSYHCARLDHAPYVCNSCEHKIGCRLDKSYYRATTANRQYRTVLVEARTGINVSEAELAEIDALISPLIQQGQSPYTILANHPEIPFSEKTIYNYIESGALSVKNLDLPKKVKYKVRQVRSSHDNEKADASIYEGRSYKDFLALLKEYPDTRITEMDTVVGCEGSRKVLLTLHFVACDFMMAFLLESKESSCVEKQFNYIETSIGTLCFCTAMPLILTDRGVEFSHPERLECGTDNTIRTGIYYCDPMCSWQKPHCEKNHEYIRKICPKGTSFDKLTQKDVNLMMSHINSAPRESLGGHTPFALARMMMPKELLEFFGLTEISPDEVVLTPCLLKK